MEPWSTAVRRPARERTADVRLTVSVVKGPNAVAGDWAGLDAEVQPGEIQEHVEPSGS